MLFFSLYLTATLSNALFEYFQSSKSNTGSGGGLGSGGTGSGGTKRRTHADQIPDSEKPFSCECELLPLFSTLGRSTAGSTADKV